MNSLTVFTPTYNRKKTLTRLYASLLNQTCHDFTWIIVDDGSTDGTRFLVEDWIANSPFQIKYFSQENSGKPSAHNRGVKETDTELFTCVDSDDILTFDAIEFIRELDCSDVQSVGFLLKKGNLDGSSLTSWNCGLEKTTLSGAYMKYGLSGDAMLVFKSNVIKKYKFPSFPGEKFVPESYLYDLIDQEGYLIVYDKVLYLCEYLPDGISANMRKTNAMNPRGYLAYIENRLKNDRTLKEKILDTIRYDAIIWVAQKRGIRTKVRHSVLVGLLFFPSYVFYLKEYAKYTRI